MNRLRFMIFLLLVWSLTSCQSYHLGNPKLLKSVGILPIKNEAFVMQSEFLLAESALQELLRDGSINICDANEADWLLEVVITDLKREESARSSDDTGRASSFKLTLSVVVRILDSETGNVLKGKTIDADTVIYTEQGLLLAERNAVVVLARDLGQQIRDFLLADW